MPLRATLGFITPKILQYLTTIVILSRFRATLGFITPKILQYLTTIVIQCPVGPLRATLGFITPKILQYLTTIVILSRRAASCYSWFYYS